MSLITCCPACGTMFKVVPDQLKISEGWVRCGHCANIFDAQSHLVQEPVAQAPAPVEERWSPAVEASPPAEREVPPPIAWQPSPPVRSPAPAAQPASSDWDRLSDPGPEEDLGPEPSPTAVASGWPARFDRPSRDDVAADPYVASRDAGADSVAPDEVSFVVQARRQAFWRRPLVRAMLALAGLLLAGLLALQYAVYDRDRLAAMQPGLRALLDPVCARLGCTLGPPRQIEAIDSSSFNRMRGDAYRLSFTLKNNAQVPVAAPAMELTLTDTLDQAVLRRVLTPEELGAASPVIPAGADWSGSVSLAVASLPGASRIAGYRLLAFYP
jgi:predicted Zn finger-like uncharacterized protein